VDPGGAFEKHKAVYELVDTYLLWNPTQQQVFATRERDVLRGYQKAGKNNYRRLQRGTLTQTPEGDTPHRGHRPQRGTPHSLKNKRKIHEDA